uniref:Unconventional prefoldin RPB5 interactor n=1 Tax=Lygus hesperus TaxID=30085 RepID=A0A0A9YUX8_LYGHE
MDPNQAPFALEHQLISGLIQNRETTEIWERRKKEHEELKGNLSFYTEKMKHRIFAPLGKKAMMKAELIHTNEITVSLGLGWFVKVSAKDAIEICQRRISECDVMLKKCEAERALFEGRRDARLRNEAFGGKEIIEKFDEKEEEKWRDEHREKVKKHKKELAEVKDKVKQTTTETEEDLWKLLDMLELREELEDELSRLGEESGEEDEESDESEESDGDEYDTGENGIDEEPPKEKKRVRFGLDPVAESHEAPDSPPEDPKLVRTTAVKDEISETKPAVAAGGNTVKLSRPASKFKKSRQGNAE